MKNVIGNPARKDNFYPRNMEVEAILNALERGENIQIASPRRVGKTSILHYLVDNEYKEFLFVCIDTESSSSSQSFFKKILDEIVKSEAFSKGGRFFNSLKNILDKIGSITLAGQGIEFVKTQDVDYFQDLKILLENVNLGDQKLVILIDEFTMTIDNIHKKESSESAKDFLYKNRELRQNYRISENVGFVYTGSIGLNGLVERLGATKSVNDLSVVEVPPLTQEQGEEFARLILESEQIEYSQNVLLYLLVKVDWLTPFYIKLVIHELKQCLLRKRVTEATLTDIDIAFDKAVGYNYNNYYEHYFSRLKEAFKDGEFKFVIEVLNQTVENGLISDARTIDMANEFNVAMFRKSLLRTLEFDGYLTKTGNSYVFTSPLLKAWWNENV